MPLTDEERAMRKTGIAATDATAVVGVNKWKTPLHVYAEKVSDEVDEPSPEAQERFKVGHALEGPIMSLLADSRRLTLAPTTTERHGIITWALATPDRLVLDRPGGSRIAVAEAKVVGARMARDWDDGVPEYVHVQVAWQMLVTKTQRAYVAALLYGTDFRIYELERDPDLDAAALEVCQQFWEGHVIPRVPPAVDGAQKSREALHRLYPRVRKPELVVADAEAERWARAFLEARAAKEEAAARQLEAENHLKALIGEAPGAVGAGWKATWSERQGAVSWKRAVEQLLGETPQEVLEKFRGAPTRAFDVKPLTAKGR